MAKCRTRREWRPTATARVMPRSGADRSGGSAEGLGSVVAEVLAEVLAVALAEVVDGVVDGSGGKPDRQLMLSATQRRKEIYYATK